MNKQVITCAGCRAKLAVTPAMSGTRACPRCGYTIHLPPALNEMYDSELDDAPVPASHATKYCHHCGSVIAALAEICPKCGVRQPELATSRSVREDCPSKIAAALFAIFLGVLGIHKFYLKQTGTGVAYLLLTVLLFWTIIVPAVIALVAFIEGIVYLTYSDQEFAQRFAKG